LVAGAHAGWRGLANGVLQATVQAMAEQAHCSVGELCRDVHVWLGPCIGPAAFEVGAEVRAAFVAQHPQAHAWFELVEPTQSQLFGNVAGGIRTAAGLGSSRAIKYLANLPALAQLVLSDLGIVSVTGNDASPAWCTSGNPDVYFSYRRDQQTLGGSGRMAAFIGLQAC
jgi:copper oxidase (laccase) domain-containing protein